MDGQKLQRIICHALLIIGQRAAMFGEDVSQTTTLSQHYWARGSDKDNVTAQLHGFGIAKHQTHATSQSRDYLLVFTYQSYSTDLACSPDRKPSLD